MMAFAPDATHSAFKFTWLRFCKLVAALSTVQLRVASLRRNVSLVLVLIGFTQQIGKIRAMVSELCEGQMGGNLLQVLHGTEARDA